MLNSIILDVSIYIPMSLQKLYKSRRKLFLPIAAISIGGIAVVCALAAVQSIFVPFLKVKNKSHVGRYQQFILWFDVLQI